jgi:molecular chaperone GrpE
MSEQTPETNKQDPKEENLQPNDEGVEQAAGTESDGAQEASADKQDTAGNDGLTLQQALDRLAEAEETMAAHQSEVLRLHADMQNIRRRAEQDVERAHKYGQEKLVSELLPVIDNLERALQAAADKDDELVTALKQGVELTLKSFTNCLQKFNVLALDPVGEPFNPEFHQAMGMMESETAEPDSVVAVMQKGYTLNGRVLRPAMVMVAKAPSGAGGHDGVSVKA